ncbi:hypothetical protein OHA25_28620 [Nonomuraea sp. NBC_00507]|uniref:hypothetical protein n=1 Tax=Nonomuraea sp. NBC_00507 TaxID=2976002 RepID=UPI002E19A076
MSTAQYVQAHPDHRVGVRLGQLLSLLDRADVDPLFRQEIVHIPSDHPTFRWRCAVHGCQRHPATSSKLCSLHAQRWRRADRDWLAFAAFIAAEEPLIPLRGGEQPRCIICPERPARGPIQRLCVRHGDRWHHAVGFDPSLAFEQWVLSEEAFPGFGSCLVTACEDLAESPLLLCRFHRLTYQRHDSPGGASLPSRWARFYDGRGKPTPVSYVDEDQFRRWCARAPARLVVGQLNLLGLRPLARAEIQWTLVKHTEGDRTQWRLPLLQGLVNICRERDLNSVADLDVAALRRPHQAIVTEMLNELRLIYFTPAQTREAGFIETDHFGVRFTQRQSHYDLTDITQRWLRDLVWDVMADLLRSPRCPRSGGTFDGLRRGAVSLSAFLEAEVSGAGHDPTVLRAEHMHRFLADMRHRERHGLLARGIHRRDGRPSIVTAITRMYVFSTVHRLFRFALDSGAADRLGLDRHFILAARPEEGSTLARAGGPSPTMSPRR